MCPVTLSTLKSTSMTSPKFDNVVVLLGAVPPWICVYSCVRAFVFQLVCAQALVSLRASVCRKPSVLTDTQSPRVLVGLLPL